MKTFKELLEGKSYVVTNNGVNIRITGFKKGDNSEEFRELFEGKSYVVTNNGVTIRITGFKKGDDPDEIGNILQTEIGNAIKKLPKNSFKEVNIKLK